MPILRYLFEIPDYHDIPDSRFHFHNNWELGCLSSKYCKHLASCTHPKDFPSAHYTEWRFPLCSLGSKLVFALYLKK